MAKRGRKKRQIPTVSKCVRIPEDVAIKIDRILNDPFTGKIEYGALSTLVTKLLREWLHKIEKEKEK